MSEAIPPLPQYAFMAWCSSSSSSSSSNSVISLGSKRMCLCACVCMCAHELCSLVCVELLWAWRCSSTHKYGLSSWWPASWRAAEACEVNTQTSMTFARHRKNRSTTQCISSADIIGSLNRAERVSLHAHWRLRVVYSYMRHKEKTP